MLMKNPNQIFFQEGELAAAHIFSMFPPDRISDMVNFANLYSTGTAAAARRMVGTSENAGFAPFAFLSKQYLPDAQIPAVLTGISALLISYFKAPKMSNDDYEAIFNNLFNLPPDMADSLAKKVETSDILAVTTLEAVTGPDGKTTYREKVEPAGYMERAWGFVVDVLNSLPKGPFSSWEIDANQKYDTDFLYEMKLLGEVVTELTTRMELMRSQAALARGAGMFTTAGIGDIQGDVAYNNPEFLQDVAAVGDLARKVRVGAKRRVPYAMYGKSAPVAAANDLATAHALKEMLPHPGSSETGDIMASANPLETQKIARGSIALGDPGMIELFKRVIKTGKVPDSLMALIAGQQATDAGDIETAIGDINPTISQALATGDIRGFVKGLADVANADVTTGDPALDAQLEAEYGDIDPSEANGDPLIGGLFANMRANMAKAHTANVARRVGRRQTRHINRNIAQSATQQARADRATIRNSYDPSLGMQAPTYQGNSYPMAGVANFPTYGREQFDQPYNSGTVVEGPYPDANVANLLDTSEWFA